MTDHHKLELPGGIGAELGRQSGTVHEACVGARRGVARTVGSRPSAVMTSWIYGSRVPGIKPIWVCVSGVSYIGYRI